MTYMLFFTALNPTITLKAGALRIKNDSLNLHLYPHLVPYAPCEKNLDIVGRVQKQGIQISVYNNAEEELSNGATT